MITMQEWVFLLAVVGGGGLGALLVALIVVWQQASRRVDQILAERAEVEVVERQRDAALMVLETHGPTGWSDLYWAQITADMIKRGGSPGPP